MSQPDPYGEQQAYSEQPYAEPYAGDQPAQPQPDKEKSGSGVSVPTILASAGIAAVVSALIVTIGVVGLATSDKFGNDSAAAEPTVVNLGSGQGTQGSNGAVGQQNSGDQATNGETGAAAPTENVPESNGDAGAGSGTQGTDGGAATNGSGNGAGGNTGSNSGGTQANNGAQANNGTQSQTPAPLTAGQLNTKVKTIMNTGASDATRADELEGGQRALSSVNSVAEMLRVSGAGFTYKVVGPVNQSGKTLNARLQMSLVGNGSRYLNLSWVWVDGKWKLSNKSVCAITDYAMLKCAV